VQSRKQVAIFELFEKCAAGALGQETARLAMIQHPSGSLQKMWVNNSRRLFVMQAKSL
jgi:hypothetical protein